MVNFIQSRINLGFAKANNKAYEIASSSNILFLNPDTEILGNAISEMYKLIELLPDACIIGPKLLNTDRSIQTSCIRSFPTIANQFFESEFLRKIFPKAKFWGMSPLFRKIIEPFEVNAVSGACLMIKRDVFEKVRFFSEEYFMYSEDIDLCHKVKNVGGKIYYTPKAVVIHHGGASTSSDNSKMITNVTMLESRAIYFAKFKSNSYSQMYRVSMFVASILRLCLLSVIWPLVIMKRPNHKVRNIFNKYVNRLKWSIRLNTTN
jgi:hypothetical protein